MLSLDDKVTTLSKVGKALAARLKHLGLETVRDLIFYYPFRYEDYSQIVPIKSLQPGLTATIRARVDIIASRRSPRRRKVLTEAILSDESGEIKVIWFNQPWISKSLKAGDEIFISGKVSGNLFDYYFNSPSYEPIKREQLHTARLVPVYSATEGLTQKQLRFLINQALPARDQIVDFLPEVIRREQELLPLGQALGQLHFPRDFQQAVVAKKRLAFDELFLIQLWSTQLRNELGGRQAPQIIFQEQATKDFVNHLPFALTADQKKAAWEIIRDLGQTRPMNRLLQGDVGSGKTVVAALAMYNAKLGGGQSVLMAPTEILARQHFENMNKLFSGTETRLGLITRTNRLLGDKQLTKKEFLRLCLAGEIDIIVGTHAVIQPAVNFNNLALVVIDEQHRFGVKQRQELQQKNKQLVPHFLSLTATPIPRSLALTVYGDLDISLIRELPAGRRPVLTKIVPPEKRQLAYNFIGQEIAAGRQVFVICPLIDPSDRLGVRSVTEEFERLDQEIFPHLTIGLLHGRLKTAEKEKVMRNFVANRVKILVATSVVEVGVDIPNATVMMIEGAERFGLAQLHQFRGRVGRSIYQSYCFLFSDSADSEIISRLTNLVNCRDGFALAQKDLELRGAGKIFGYEQSGFADLKIADLSDLSLVKQTREAVANFLAHRQISDFPALTDKLNTLGLAGHLE